MCSEMHKQVNMLKSHFSNSFLVERGDFRWHTMFSMNPQSITESAKGERRKGTPMTLSKTMPHLCQTWAVGCGEKQANSKQHDWQVRTVTTWSQNSVGSLLHSNRKHKLRAEMKPHGHHAVLLYASPPTSFSSRGEALSFTHYFATSCLPAPS